MEYKHLFHAEGGNEQRKEGKQIGKKTEKEESIEKRNPFAVSRRHIKAFKIRDGERNKRNVRNQGEK